MSTAAAFSLPDNRDSDLLRELNQILKQFDTLPSAVQRAIASVVESLLRDPDLSDAEIAHLNALLPHQTRGAVSRDFLRRGNSSELAKSQATDRD